MADLSVVEKIWLEKLFQMKSGYVLNFTNRTFQEFVLESTGLDICDDKYSYASGSKANRLRAFWNEESGYTVAKLIEALLEYYKAHNVVYDATEPLDESLYSVCLKIPMRLRQETPVESIEAIQPNVDDRDFEVLAKSIREYVARDEPEVALDRLHTFTVRYVRELCRKHSIDFDKNDPLHSIFGKYVKYLLANDMIESEMGERILKASVSTLESFNDVRNNKSFAHDNNVMGYHEGVLIVTNVSAAIRFMESIEAQNAEKQRLEIDGGVSGSF